MAQEFALTAPTTEEMTATAVALAGGGVAGVVEGAIVLMAPKTGELSPFISWGTLIGVPLIGAAAALFTGGMIGDFFKGVAAGGVGILGYSLPAMLLPAVSRRPSNPGGGQPEIKQLPAGRGSPQEAQRAGVRSVVEF